MLQTTICAFLAPALVSAYAFPWAGPEPTLVIPEQDNWTPAPTDAPVVGELELFKRADDNTCGYISGEASRSLTCNNANYVCATNTYYGVHGCCDPNGISTCSIPTTCIESSRLSASCTGDCSSNDYIAKCTDASEPFCYQWRYVYDSTVMTEFGCASEAFTTSVLRTINGASSRLPSEISVSDEITSTSSSSSTSTSATSTNTAPPQETGGKKSTNVGAIVGGVVGGLVVIGALVFGIVFMVLRNKKQKQNAANVASGASQPFMSPAPGVTEYKPQPGGYNPQQQYPAGGEAAGYFNNAQNGQNGQEQSKAWQGQYGSPPTSPAPQYPGIAPMQPMVPAGVAEAGGTPVPGHPQNASVYEAPDTSRQT